MSIGAILNKEPSGQIPVGLIAMWSGESNNIPNSWALCDGNNGTPDLRDRFIVGAGSSYSVGDTGGSDTVTLTAEQMPSHNHSGNVTLSGLSTSSAGSHTHNFQFADDDAYIFRYGLNDGRWDGIVVNDNPSYSKSPITIKSSGSHTHTISASNATATLTSNGNNQAHENRPPYYALCFIMKIA